LTDVRLPGPVTPVAMSLRAAAIASYSAGRSATYRPCRRRQSSSIIRQKGPAGVDPRAMHARARRERCDMVLEPLRIVQAAERVLRSFQRLQYRRGRRAASGRDFHRVAQLSGGNPPM
jgi:hypothetical protein